MAILIDGYNLLHASGVFSDAVGPGSVEKLHAAFLSFLAESLDPGDLPRTTVVFDSRGRRAVKRRMLRFGDMVVHYSSRDEDADTLLAELIDQHSTPRQLVVVSSDHQVQRAARRRRAKPVDSEVWYAELLRLRRNRRRTEPQTDAKPATPLSQNDTAWWLAQFGAEVPTEPPADATEKNPKTSEEQPAPKEDEVVTGETDKTASTDPFPQSYLDEIQRDLLSDVPALPVPKSRLGKAAKPRRKRS